MKKTAFVCWLLFLPVFLPGQAHPFKAIVKNSPVNVHPGISFRTIDGSHPLKRAQQNSVPYRPLSFQGLGIPDRKFMILTDGGQTPVFLERETPPLKSQLPAGERLYAFLEAAAELTGMENPREWITITDTGTDELGITHVKGFRHYRGIPLYGSQFTFHVSPDKERFTGRIPLLREQPDINPALTAGEALRLATEEVSRETVYKPLSEKEQQILDYREPRASLLLYRLPESGRPVLAWDIEIRPNFLESWRYFVDASSGEIIRKYNSTPSDGPQKATAYDLNGLLRTIDTYLENGVYYMMNTAESMFNAATGEGVIVTLDANHTSTNRLNYKEVTSPNNSWNSPAAVSAHYNATRTFQYLKNTFGRNSINGQGGNIISFVNVAEDDGSSMENAFWNGKAAFYGNGGSSFKPLAGALDVSAHELGHGVVSNTANLEYYGQSGAINETYADIFGSMVDRDDWKIGEDITRTSFSPSGALRDMQDPHNMGTQADDYWQPRHVSEMYLGSGDNGGVHINNGIGNHAYYLYATAVTKEKAEQVFYRALTRYLTMTSQFIDFRIAVIQSAKDLYGGNSSEAAEAAEAFDKVGIYQEEPVAEQQDYNVNPGQEFLLCYNTYWMDSNTLYQSSAEGTGFVPLSKTSFKGKPSVTDNGEFAVFVSGDNKIRLIDLTTRVESVIQEDPFWDNVALSKDGNHLAAISTVIDTAIYVYDFTLGEWAKFRLYNPTTSHSGTNAGGVLYADAIEFDHTGQYLMYDAYNELTSGTYEDISYWDIGFIRIWDNGSNDFGDGAITKLFGNLPEKVSVGNAVFSKNSADIIAFDYLDESTDEYAILGLNLESGDLDIIFENSILGFPSFSKNDNKIAFSAENNTDEEVVGVVNLASNKISPSGPASILIDDAKWPVFFATGTRTLGLPPVAQFSVDLKTGEAPLQVRFLDLSVNSPTEWLWNFAGGNPASSTLQHPQVTYPAEGTYEVTLTVTNDYGNNTATKKEYITVSKSTPAITTPLDEIRVFPNPFRDMLTISPAGRFQATLYDLEGMKLLEWTGSGQTDLSHLCGGVYILEIQSGNTISRNRIVKQ